MKEKVMTAASIIPIVLWNTGNSCMNSTTDGKRASGIGSVEWPLLRALRGEVTRGCVGSRVVSCRCNLPGVVAQIAANQLAQDWMKKEKTLGEYKNNASMFFFFICRIYLIIITVLSSVEYGTLVAIIPWLFKNMVSFSAPSMIASSNNMAKG